jgi:hypothetical protein
MALHIKNPFKTEESLEQLQEREERVTLQLSIAQKEAMIKQLEAKGKQWQHFSTNGKKSGISFEKVRAWLRGNKGGKK